MIREQFVIPVTALDEYLEKAGPHKYTSKKMVQGKWVYEYKDEAVTRIANSLLDFLANPKRTITLAQVSRSFRLDKAKAKEVIDTLARQGNITGSTEPGGVTTYKRNPRQKAGTEKPKLVIPETPKPEEKPVEKPLKTELTEKEKKQVDENRYRGKAELLRLFEKKGTVWLDQHPNIKQSDLTDMAVSHYVERVTDFAGETADEGFRVGYRLTGTGERAINNMNNEQRKELQKQQYEQKKKKIPPKKDQPKLAKEAVLNWFQPQGPNVGINAVGMTQHFAYNLGLHIPSDTILSAMNKLVKDGVLTREGEGHTATFKKVKPKTNSDYKPQKQGQLSFEFNKARFIVKAG